MSNFEVDLVRNAQTGDERAFNELYRSFYNQAYYFALKITNCDADAQDAVQESFITIKTSLKDLHEVKSFRKWMFQIILSKCNKIFRKNKYTILDPDVINTLPVEERRSYMSGEKHIDYVSRHEWLMSLIAQLTLNQREILVLMYFYQLSIKEISEVLHIPEGTVKSRLVSAKAALKKKMEHSEDMKQFRVLCPLPLLLLLMYRKDYETLMNEKQKVKLRDFIRYEPPTVFMAILFSLIVSIGSVFAFSYMKHAEEREIMDYATYTDETGTYTQKDIYYKLTDWAHCHIEMEQKTWEERKQMLPYYNFLKDKNGPYYERLKAYNHWADDFEKIMK